MAVHEPHRDEHAAGGGTDADLDAAEKAVADAIEEVVDVPTSIEEEALLEAAEIEEVEEGSPTSGD